MNLVDRDCPNEKCTYTKQDVQGCLIKHDEKKGDESYTHYRCPQCKINYGVSRKGDTAEQELVQKYIDASKIILKK